MAYILPAVGCTNGCAGGTNPCASTAPTPALKIRTASGSKTKCGWDELDSPSTPPKKYLVKTLSGTAVQTQEDGCGGDLVVTTTVINSGACSYSRATCARTDSGAYRRIDSFESNHSLDTDTTTPTCGISGGFVDDATWSVSNTVQSVTYGGTCSGGTTHTGSLTETLSSEYSTAYVIADAVSAAGSVGSWTTGAVESSIIASLDLDTDELTATVSFGDYKFQLPTLTGASCYKLEWNETFTPVVGSPTTTARSYLWDGTATETGVFFVATPGTSGEVTITDLVASFDCA